MTNDHHRWYGIAALLLLPTTALAQSASQLESTRHRMVEEIIIANGIKDRRVIASIRETPRHSFVGSHLRKQAYYDMALPIGHNQTISSPFIVAYMTESLEPKPTDKVLEIGTGSGYQAAVLSPLVKDVYTIEIIEELGRKAKATLRRLKYDNVHAKVGDGFKGWPEHAPFNKIIVTCSPEAPPKPLIDQLAEGGLMVIPAGQRYQQTLYLLRKKNGKMYAEALRPTLFVPMTGRAEDLRRVQPDSANPAAVNGDFEAELPKNGFIRGWYYQRLLELVKGPEAPQGEQCVKFVNDEQGRSAHVMQGISMDGREVKEIEISALVKYKGLYYAVKEESFPSIVITFYDENRKNLGHNWIGPFRGESDWKKVSKRFRVPPTTREGILRIGLYGVTGEISFDAIQLKKVND